MLQRIISYILVFAWLADGCRIFAKVPIVCEVTNNKARASHPCTYSQPQWDSLSGSYNKKRVIYRQGSVCSCIGIS
ncbi:hypothetical protein BDR26DRAFT_860192, partial [Obelidium mucronatum]